MVKKNNSQNHYDRKKMTAEECEVLKEIRKITQEKESGSSAGETR